MLPHYCTYKMQQCKSGNALSEQKTYQLMIMRVFSGTLLTLVMCMT